MVYQYFVATHFTNFTQKERTMTRFVHTELPASHAGANRLENASALLAKSAATFAQRLRNGLSAWQAAREARAEDSKLWEVAYQDARVMSDLSAAMSRHAAA
jgi:hypothetical protein